MRGSHWSQSSGSQSFMAGFLLAIDDRRCSEASICMRSMSKILPQDDGLGVAGAIDSSIMASTKVGHRHHRKVDSNSRQLHLHSGRINSFGKFEHGSTLVLTRISCITSGSALLKNEQKIKLGGYVGAHKTPISSINMSSKCIK
jgi:hypothetical protein